MSKESLSEELYDTRRGFGAPILLPLLTVIAGGLLCWGLYLAFFSAPTEAQMGFVQKIFYFHVPAAWVMLISAPLMAFSSVAYLVKRTERWDRMGDAVVELAILFGALVLISGPLWGRKAWGVYWVWDVRLTSSLVLVLTLVASKIVRAYAGESRKTIFAGLSGLAVLNAIFVYVSVDIWRGTHPEKLVTKKGGLDPDMRQAFWVCVVAFLVTFSVMLWTRIRVGKLETALERLQGKATEAGLFER